MQTKDAVTTGKAADLLGVARQTILREIKRGNLPAEQLEVDGRTYHRIALDDLKAYQAKREAKILNAPINQTGPLSRVRSTTALADTQDGGA